MNVSEMHTARTKRRQLPPTTVEGLLDHEEALAIQRIADSVQRLGDDLCAATGVRERIRRHPFVATGLGAIVGFIGGPLILQAFERASGVSNSASPRTQSLPGLVLTSLRAVRSYR
jgi:hypothetical protein